MVKRGSWEALRARLAREQTILVSLTLAYVILGKLGLALAYSDRAASLVSPPGGCRFHPRCDFATDICRTTRPAASTIAGGHWVRCHHPCVAVS